MRERERGKVKDIDYNPRDFKLELKTLVRIDNFKLYPLKSMRDQQEQQTPRNLHCLLKHSANKSQRSFGKMAGSMSGKGILTMNPCSMSQKVLSNLKWLVLKVQINRLQKWIQPVPPPHPRVLC